MPMRLAAAAALFLACVFPAAADEVWASAKGHQVVYDRDVGTTAVFTYKPEQGLAQGQIFVVGLAGQSEGRSTYAAYWVEEADAGPNCPAKLVDAEGKTWSRWGPARVSFAKPGFPSAIRIARGDCLGPLAAPVRLKPVVGAGIK